MSSSDNPRSISKADAESERKSESSSNIDGQDDREHTDRSQPLTVRQSSPIDIKRPAPHDRRSLEKKQLESDDLPKSVTFQIKENQVPIQNLIKTANTMSNMMIAHRIALEDEFKLEPGLELTGPMMSLSPIIGSSPSQLTNNNIEAAREQNLEAKIKEIMHDAYWDTFRDELKTHNSDPLMQEKQTIVGTEIVQDKYRFTKQLLRDIRQRMIDLLLPQHTRFKQDIEDRMDFEVIDQLCKVNSLDLKDYSQYILSVLSRLCAPVRDVKIEELIATDDVVHQYRGIMELMEMMRLDWANFTINRFKTHIKAHSQEYERDKFNEILSQQQNIGIDGLEYTRIWLRRAVDRFQAAHGSLIELIKEQAANREENLNNEDEDDPDVDQHDVKDRNTKQCNRLTSESINFHNHDQIKQATIYNKELTNRILNTAYSELLDWSQTLQKLYPETLVCDEATFKHIAEQIRLLISTSAILLTSFAFINRFKLNDINEFKILIKNHVITLLTATYESSISPDPSPSASNLQQQTSKVEDLDQNKLETIVTRLKVDFETKIKRDNEIMLPEFENQYEIFRRQILDLENSTNRVRELSKRRIFEFIETLLMLDVKHQQKKKMPPPVEIPLGLNSLTSEITLITAQLVKIIRYNRRVFFDHYEKIIVDSICNRIIDRK